MLFAVLGFSQTDSTKAQVIDKQEVQKINTVSSATAEPKTKKLINDEGTNDPLLNGYTKTLINGKEVYIKDVTKGNVKIKTVYTPEN